MASNNPLDPWALPPPLTDRRPGSVPTTTASAPPGPAPLRTPHLQSQAREPGELPHHLDVRALLSGGRGRAILQRLGALDISPGSHPQDHPVPGRRLTEYPLNHPELFSLAENCFEVRLMLGFDVELPRIDQQRRPRIRPVAVCRPSIHVPPLPPRGFRPRPFPR